jgi:hypothetical protein
MIEIVHMASNLGLKVKSFKNIQGCKLNESRFVTISPTKDKGVPPHLHHLLRIPNKIMQKSLCSPTFQP